MKKRSLVLSLCCLMALGVGVGVTSCGDNTVQTGELTITGYTGSIEVGASVQLAVEGATDVKFSSSNTDVVTVNATGLMKGIAEGTATIIAKSGDLEGTISVTIVKKADGGTGDNTGDGDKQEDGLLVTLTKDNCAGLVASIKNDSSSVYAVTAYSETIGGIKFNFAGGKVVGFCNSQYNSLLGGNLKAFQIKKEKINVITTTTSLKVTKIVVNQLMETQYTENPTPLTISVGGTAGVAAFGTAVAEGSDTGSDGKSKEISSIETTYTFTNASGALDVSNGAYATYFNSMKIYGSINA
jgi:hypothetical protein